MSVNLEYCVRASPWDSGVELLQTLPSPEGLHHCSPVGGLCDGGRRNTRISSLRVLSCSSLAGAHSSGLLVRHCLSRHQVLLLGHTPVGIHSLPRFSLSRSVL